MGKVQKLAAAYYKTMYLKLFNAATDAIWKLENAVGDENAKCAMDILIRAQQECEEIYISEGERAKTVFEKRRLSPPTPHQSAPLTDEV